MAKLILTHDGNVLGEFELTKEMMTIGRKPENDIQIDNLAVSGQHAKVITILSDSFLEDMGSTNGTFVNGSLIKKHALQDGDSVTIGKHKLKYINEAAGKSKTGDEFEQTMIIRPDAAGMPEDVSGQTLERSVVEVNEKVDASIKASKPAGAAASSGKTAKLQVLSGANTGKELELTKALTTIGRPGLQVAALTRRPQGYFIIHVEGGDGTFPTINGSSIGTQARQLSDHDIIEVAGVKMEFFLS